MEGCNENDLFLFIKSILTPHLDIQTKLPQWIILKTTPCAFCDYINNSLLIYKGLNVMCQFVRKGIGNSVFQRVRIAAEIERVQVKWAMKNQK